MQGQLKAFVFEKYLKKNHFEYSRFTFTLVCQFETVQVLLMVK
jgi:hypothetical protein